MSFDETGSWLVLDGAELPDGWGEQALPVKRASGVLEAAVHLAKSKPAAVVVNPQLGWHDTFVRLLPPDIRHRVIAPADLQQPSTKEALSRKHQSIENSSV